MAPAYQFGHSVKPIFNGQIESDSLTVDSTGWISPWHVCIPSHSDRVVDSVWHTRAVILTPKSNLNATKTHTIFFWEVMTTDKQ